MTRPWSSGFATFSRCKRYRFDLGRLGSEGKGICLFVLNNSSTEDSLTDDATVRRGWGYTCAWGYRTMVFVNVNPWRATYPSEAELPPENIAKQNDDALGKWAKSADMIVAAWGADARLPAIQRALSILQKFSDVHALELCKDGTPKHILYLKGDLKPIARYMKFSSSRTKK